VKSTEDTDEPVGMGARATARLRGLTPRTSPVTLRGNTTVDVRA
jgi:hypothetical protein